MSSFLSFWGLYGNSTHDSLDSTPSACMNQPWHLVSVCFMLAGNYPCKGEICQISNFISLHGKGFSFLFGGGGVGGGGWHGGEGHVGGGRRVMSYLLALFSTHESSSLLWNASSNTVFQISLCTDRFLISMTLKAEQINVKAAVLLTTNPHNKKLCYFPYHLFLFLSCVKNGGNKRKQNVAEITEADSW